MDAEERGQVDVRKDGGVSTSLAWAQYSRQCHVLEICGIGSGGRLTTGVDGRRWRDDAATTERRRMTMGRWRHDDRMITRRQEMTTGRQFFEGRCPPSSRRPYF